MEFSNRYRILYAENDDDGRTLVRMMCEFSNIEVVTADTVAQAWRLAQSEYFDLYLLDSQFPGGDGLELCRRLREHAPTAPIIIYSAKAYETDKKNGLAAGADAYLTKPYLGDLAATIRQIIEQHKHLTPQAGKIGVRLR